MGRTPSSHSKPHVEPCPRCQQLRDDVKATLSGRVATHRWVDADDLIRWPHCAECGVIRRRDGATDDRPCKGPARIELRADEGRGTTPVGARVKFRDDHECYAGMVGTVEEIIDLGIGRPYASVRLDSVAATADEIEPLEENP